MANAELMGEEDTKNLPMRDSAPWRPRVLRREGAFEGAAGSLGEVITNGDPSESLSCRGGGILVGSVSIDKGGLGGRPGPLGLGESDMMTSSTGLTQELKDGGYLKLKEEEQLSALCQGRSRILVYVGERKIFDGERNKSNKENGPVFSWGTFQILKCRRSSSSAIPSPLQRNGFSS